MDIAFGDNVLTRPDKPFPDIVRLLNFLLVLKKFRMTAKYISYQIIFKLNKELELQIGKLGRFIFPVGLYIYTGSAKNNINQRIERHKKRIKTKY